MGVKIRFVAVVYPEVLGLNCDFHSLAFILGMIVRTKYSGCAKALQRLAHVFNVESNMDRMKYE